ncbi:nicotinamide mononucleotide transporter [Adhaeribacter sp. BT258]|uniref:Nicotinamide riboside transporter PnuC n=1 Tax=Adhaeribacter terrigena TaxID=2793070 RepID=A0ABS1BWQ2_9BACT|nr:nicotinamide riboside transporter PnuC [Adhaeribacter terrigena]MBK0401475.1 nicotinamide mononucleotide transporter [Adhaeribacter terrigena]
MPELNYFEVTGVISGLLGVWLAVRQNVWTWPVGLISVLAYTVFFYQIKLYADMGLQIFYAGSAMYGWYEWLRGGKNHTELPVSKLSAKARILVVLGGAIGTVALGAYFQNFTDAHYPVLDSGLAAYSLMGQFLLTRKKIENWILWFAVDVVYVWLYFQKEAYLTAGLYFVFLGLAIQGYVKWRRELALETT